MTEILSAFLKMHVKGYKHLHGCSETCLREFLGFVPAQVGQPLVLVRTVNKYNKQKAHWTKKFIAL